MPLRKTLGKFEFNATTWDDKDLFRWFPDERKVRAYVHCGGALRVFEVYINDDVIGEPSLVMVSR